MVPRRLILRELLAEKQYLGVGQVHDEAEDEVEEHRVLPLPARVLEQRHQVGLQHLDLAQPATHLVVVVITPELREVKESEYKQRSRLYSRSRLQGQRFCPMKIDRTSGMTLYPKTFTNRMSMALKN